MLAVLLVATLAGIITQLLNGYTHFELDIYLLYFILPALLSFGFLSMLALCIHTLVPNKYMGYFAFILVIVLNIFLWSGIDVESNLVQLNGSPGLRFSDMARFGPFVKGWVFFRVYWWVFGAILLFVAFLFAIRGKETGARWRFHMAAHKNEDQLAYRPAVVGRLARSWRMGVLQHQSAQHVHVRG